MSTVATLVAVLEVEEDVNTFDKRAFSKVGEAGEAGADGVLDDRLRWRVLKNIFFLSPGP